MSSSNPSSGSQPDYVSPGGSPRQETETASKVLSERRGSGIQLEEKPADIRFTPEGSGVFSDGTSDIRFTPDAQDGTVEEKESPPASEPNPSASATGLSDSPSDKDHIGFERYVRAVGRFLCDPDTKPPLTLSVEGRWGSGKSSFLLQLAKEIRRLQAEKTATDTPGSPESKVYTVWFNAWRSDNEEALWAAFALIFIKQLSRQIPLRRRLRANVALLFERFDFNRSKFQLLQLLAFAACFFFFVVLGFIAPSKITPSAANIGAAGFSAAALLGWGYERAKKLLGNPLSRDLARYVRDPHYDDRLSFIDRFQEDFSRVLRSYVGQGRVYVFIDDLDRCEVPKAAELMQAINLLISADQPAPDTSGELRKPDPNLFFVMGLDRKVVAAGIAAKHKKVLPYLVSGKLSSNSSIRDVHKAGLEYGYEFLEKFIQVPFRVPEIDPQNNKNWISRLTRSSDAEAAPPAPPSSGSTNGVPTERVFDAGPDPDQFSEVAQQVTTMLRFNPRRVKQFINVFRLQVLILIELGVLQPASTGLSPAASSPITLEQIGLVVGIFLRWPGIIPDLLDNPQLFENLRYLDGPSSAVLDFWRSEQRLMSALGLGGPYTITRQAVHHVLDLVPDRGNVRWGKGVGRRALLYGSGEGVFGGQPPSSPGSTGAVGPTPSSATSSDPPAAA